MSRVLTSTTEDQTTKARTVTTVLVYTVLIAIKPAYGQNQVLIVSHNLESGISQGFEDS